MISFACKKIKDEELIRCSFNLNKTEYKILIFLLKNKGKIFTISQLSKRMRLERSTIQKGIKNLTEKRLVKRLQKNLSGGGYIYLYQVKNEQEIKSKMTDIIKEWYEACIKQIEDW